MGPALSSIIGARPSRPGQVPRLWHELIIYVRYGAPTERRDTEEPTCQTVAQGSEAGL